MKHADINKRFTEIVTEWIGNGYTINTATMGGSQGEYARVDLTNGSEIIRILVAAFSDWRNRLEGIEIVVGKCTDKVAPNSGDRLDTIWNDKLDVLHQERFCKVGSRSRDDYYYGTEDEAKSARIKRTNRWRNKDIAGYEKIDFATEAAVQIAKRYILRKNICKRVTPDNISVYKKIDRYGKARYVISYKATSYTLY